MTGHIRNIPCECGSGRKRKRCCAAPKPFVPVEIDLASACAVLDRIVSDHEGNTARRIAERKRRLALARGIPRPEGVPCPECRDTGSVYVGGFGPIYETQHLLPCPHGCAATP